MAFLIGCSFTFEGALLDAGVPVRHLEAGTNVPMYRTTTPTRPAGALHGPLVVSMRPVPADLVATAVRVTSRYPAVHGAPLHVGDPAALGIADLGAPDFGDPVEVRPGEVPVSGGAASRPSLDPPMAGVLSVTSRVRGQGAGARVVRVSVERRQRRHRPEWWRSAVGDRWIQAQAAVLAARPPYAIGHAPGHMAVTDARDAAYVVP